MSLIDSKARSQAIDSRRSVLVQAPAGSGKTSLLAERYLRLLEIVDEPEEILAITFTNKAASEMRQRICRYLEPQFKPENDRERVLLDRISGIRQKIESWGLLSNPQRLMIRTIDSFNHYLVRRMPVASALGTIPLPDANPHELYRRAARSVLSLLNEDDDIAADLQRLLEWRDNRQQDVEIILTDLLEKRDQWLRALSTQNEIERNNLEEALKYLIESQLAEGKAALSSVCKDCGLVETEIMSLLRFAAQNLLVEGASSEIISLVKQDTFPGSSAEDLPLWLGIGEAFLTTAKNADFRRRVSKTIGFPAKTMEKSRFTEVLEKLAGNPDLAKIIDRCRSLPSPRYDDEEWRVLESVIRVLRRTAAELTVIFAEENKIDFAGMSSAALRGLGDEQEGITDLSLYLDRKINHLLVDEFQDTNWPQLSLIKKLTLGWQIDDGRTLFVVGDPMQSIYRFREADVGLFVKLREKGINFLKIEPLVLGVNFRSHDEIVEWVNNCLGPLFPSSESIAEGAIRYTPSTSACGPGGRVEILAHANQDDEAEVLAKLFKEALVENAEDPSFTAAVVVRARSHLPKLLSAFSREEVPYRAIQLHPLLSRSVVQDLLAMTQAILLPADRTATLAMLRSPVCGLSLADLHILANEGDVLNDELALQQLSPDSRSRAERVFTALRDAQDEWYRRPIRDLVEGLWHRVGGPSICKQPNVDLRYAESYFEVLSEADENGSLGDWNRFIDYLGKRHVDGEMNMGPGVDVVTMHGAKGLEWDMVAIPGLERGNSGSDRTLLHWLPYPGRSQEEILIAPLRSARDTRDSALVALIKQEQKKRDAYENQRLLYVAATRAKKALVMSACFDKEIEDFTPRAGSMLSDIWPTTKEAFISAMEGPQRDLSKQYSEDKFDYRDTANMVYRVHSDWQPRLGSGLNRPRPLSSKERKTDIEYDWAGATARKIGVVIHQLLESVGKTGIENLKPNDKTSLIGKIPSLLRATGMRKGKIDSSVSIVADAFSSTIDNKIGSWILSSEHEDAHSELALSGVLDNEVVDVVIDRTFVDKEGARWIIDYKSGYHSGSDFAGFLAQEVERYRDQLERYARLMSKIETRKIRTALYLPRHDVLKEINL